MRITYIHQHYSLPAEGGGARPYEFAKRLQAAGHQVTVICAGSVKRVFLDNDVRVVSLPARYTNSMGYARRLISFAVFMVRATFAACRVRADVVFASSTPLTVAVPGIIGARFNRARFVLEVRDLWPEVPVALGALRGKFPIWLAKRLELWAYRSSDQIIALSPGMADGVLRVVPDKAVTVVPNTSDVDGYRKLGVDREAARAALGVGPRELLIAYAGSFGATYDVQWTVRLAAEMATADYVFRIAGEGATTAKTRQLAAELGLDPAQIFLGKIARPEVASLLLAADLSVSTLVDEPSLEHNSLNKVFDSIAAGTPVLFNHKGWLPEVLANAGAGWVVDRYSLAQAKQLIESLKSNPTARVEASTQASDLARTQFDREKLFEAFRAVVAS